jgi:hypothetical protein
LALAPWSESSNPASTGLTGSSPQIFGTALGTTLLARATGALAYMTAGDVRATWDFASLTRQDQENRERPVLLLLNTRWEETGRASVVNETGDVVEGPSTGLVHVTLRNVGLGPALRVFVRADYHDPDYPELPATFADFPVYPAMSPNDPATFTLTVEFYPPPLRVQANSFQVEGTCVDRSRQREYGIITSWEETF